MAGHDVIVVGSGIAGMSFAHAAAKAGLDALVLERDGQAGGCLRSERLATGFWFELGAHTCYNSYQGLLGMLEDRGALSRIVPRAKVPFRLLVDGQTRPITKELKVLELLLHAPRLAVARKQGATVREYYGQLVGAGNYARVFGPMFAAVPSQPADDFPAEMLFKSRTRRKEIAKSFTFDAGLGTVIDVLSQQPRVSMRTGGEVTSIQRVDGGFRVTTADGAEHQAKHVTLAVPPSVGAALTRSAFPELAAALSRIQVTPVRSLGVVVRAEHTPLERFAFLIPLSGAFYSAVSRDTVPDPAWRGFAFHSKPGLDKDQAVDQVAQVLKTERKHLEHVVQREVVLPSPRVGHAAIVEEIDKLLPATGLAITGNYFAGLSIEDCVSRSRQEVARLTGR